MGGVDRESERRRWPRLPLAIPIFVRGVDEQGKEFLEFTSALNISAGGALLAIRRSARRSTQVSLEIPSAPLPLLEGFPHLVRRVNARVIRVTHSEHSHLWALKFTSPLIDDSKLIPEGKKSSRM